MIFPATCRMRLSRALVTWPKLIEAPADGRRLEVSVVERIESLSAKLESDVLSDSEVTEDADVEPVEAGPFDDATLLVADGDISAAR